MLLAGCGQNWGWIEPNWFGARRGPSQTEIAEYNQLMRVADAAREGGDLQTAIGLYRQAATRAPLESAPLIKLGHSLSEVGAHNEAVTAFRSGLALKGDNADGRRGLGNALVALDQTQQATAEYERSLELDPSDSRTYNSMGVVLDIAGSHERAQQYYRQGLALAPENLSIRNNLGLSLALSGKYDEAIQILRPIAAHPAATPRFRQNLALVYGLAGNAEDAARIGRVDLEESAVQSNLAYYNLLRSLQDRSRSAAIGTNTGRFESDLSVRR